VAAGKPVGAPSKDFLERERASTVLANGFCKWYFDTHDSVPRDVAHGKSNRELLTAEVKAWWGDSKEAQELRQENAWSAGNATEGTCASRILAGGKQRCSCTGFFLAIGNEVNPRRRIPGSSRRENLRV
jgi:hypothetical protein